MQDHVADVEKYAKNPVDETAVQHLARIYALVMSQPETLNILG